MLTCHRNQIIKIMLFKCINETAHNEELLCHHCDFVFIMVLISKLIPNLTIFKVFFFNCRTSDNT